MKEKQDYIQDLKDVRSMMERSTKFLSLAGWAGIMPGIYALVGIYVAYAFFHFNPDTIQYAYPAATHTTSLLQLSILAMSICFLAICTAIYFSQKRSEKLGEKIWNASAKRLVMNMAVSLSTGGLLILVLLNNGLIGLIIPCTLIFYGLALFNAGKYTYSEVKSLGLLEIVLGLISAYQVSYSMVCWAIGFGLLHIVYGCYMHYRYEK